MKSSLLVPKLALGALVLSALHAVTTASPAAAAAVRWASPTGTGDPTVCSQVAPCALEAAVEHGSVQDGDEVVVMSGDYDVVSLDVNKAITVHGELGQTPPTITTSNIFGVYVTDAATVRDLDLVHSEQSFGMWVNASGALVERVTSQMDTPGGNACTIQTAGTWRDSVCWASGTNTRGLAVLSGASTGYAVTLRNLTLIGGESGLSLDIEDGDSVTVDAKNVIASGAGPDVRGLVTEGATVQVDLAGSNYAEEQEDVASGGGTVVITDAGTGTNQTAAPMFVDAANGDFHQAEGSPTIDAGVSDPVNGSTDFEGDPRAARGPTAACPERVDIGADERVTALECDPPDTSIASGPDASTTDATPTFGLASDETGATFECRVDAGAFAPCATPFTTAALGLGAHTLQARATDPSGNVDDTPATRSFTVVEPDTTLTGTPKKKVLTKKKRAKVTFAFTSSAAGGFECSLDGAAFKPCTSPLTFKAKLGKHTMQVRAVSDSGLVDPTPATYKFKVKRKS